MLQNTKTEVETLAHYEDQRRQAACIKACEGIPTEALEAGVVRRMLSALGPICMGPEWPRTIQRASGE